MTVSNMDCRKSKCLEKTDFIHFGVISFEHTDTECGLVSPNLGRMKGKKMTFHEKLANPKLCEQKIKNRYNRYFNFGCASALSVTGLRPSRNGKEQKDERQSVGDVLSRFLSRKFHPLLLTYEILPDFTGFRESGRDSC